MLERIHVPGQWTSLSGRAHDDKSSQRSKRLRVMRNEQICPFAKLTNQSISRVCLIHTTASEGKSAL